MSDSTTSKAHYTGGRTLALSRDTEHTSLYPFELNNSKTLNTTLPTSGASEEIKDKRFYCQLERVQLTVQTVVGY